jgi:hypothetical protein
MKTTIADSRRVLWAAAAAAVALVTAWFAFHAYQHPELLVGIVNLRYCI